MNLEILAIAATNPEPSWSLLWTVLGSATVGALLGGLMSLLISILNNRHQRKLWRIEKKLELYTYFAERFSRTEYWEAREGSSPDPESYYMQIEKKIARVKLLGATKIADQILQCAHEEFDLAERKVDGSKYNHEKFRKLLADLEKKMTADIAR